MGKYLLILIVFKGTLKGNETLKESCIIENTVDNVILKTVIKGAVKN